MLSNTCVGIHIYILKRYLSKWGAFHVHREVVRNGKGKLAKKKKQRSEKKKTRLKQPNSSPSYI